LSYAVRSARGDVVQLALRAAAVLAVIGVLGLSWQSQVRKAARAQASDHAASYFPQFAAERSDFNYGRYYASFRVKQLLDGDKEAAETTVVNSFFTLLYSETWGDQWSTFANPRARDGKGSAKRALLGAALAVPPLSVALAVAALAAFVGRARKQTEAERPPLLARLDELEPKLLLLALVVCGGAAFVIWQGGPALLPGDNSTVKFGYLATLIPPAIALLFAQPLRRPSFQVLSGYFLALYVIAFPVAMYYPK
ncbi:MAG TPA: hypothetical protein VEQ59_01540, partial [Polyangiaceae bacterium]|nr:hypothetical protein [Polyangiaceae bacterium]